MKVVYINCYIDPWIKIAKKLEEDYGFEPLYWVGYNDDHSDVEIPKHFPNTIFQRYFDGWKNIFPAEIEERAKSTYIDVDFLRKYASEELQAIKMCDRQDVDQKSFTFMERQRHFRNYLRKWKAFIDMYKPDLVLSTPPPHQGYDYALYLLCKHYNIPYLIFMHTAFEGRYMMINDIKSLGNLFMDDYYNYLEHPETMPEIPQKIVDRFNALKNDYNSGAPFFMATNALEDKQSHGWINLIKKFINDCRPENGRQSVWQVVTEGLDWNGKKQGVSIEDSHYSILDYSLFKLKSLKFKDSLKKYYKTLVEKPDFSEKYIFLGLHYQPEATTCPLGDIYVDQTLCVDELLANTPDDYIVYVKEHPHQFLYQMEGHTGRIKEFYDDLKARPRVKLIDLDEPTFPLIQHAAAVATICGTIGFESMVYQKPTIVFGLSWYENCPLALKIRNNEDSARIKDYIENFKYDELKMKAYLASFGKNTYYAYYYRARNKQTFNMTEEECIDEIIRSIKDNI